MLSLNLADLDRPAEETTRRLALSLLDDAVQALERLGEGRDSEALHDFRVALRRLRSLERAYRAQLRDTTPKKVRSRLKELAAATNLGRDTEVQLAWLKSRKDEIAARHRAGLKWLVKRIESRFGGGYANLHKVLSEELRALEKSLRRRLAFYRVEVRGDPRPVEIAFRSTAAARIRDHASELRANADAIHTPADGEALHKARICAKRLRYILEPLSEPLEEAGAVVERLKAFQDLLGDLNDLNVISAEIARIHEEALHEEKAAPAGVSHITALLEKEMQRLQTLLQSEWLQGQLDSLVDGVIGVAAALEGEREKNVEIERKFLLRRLPPAVKGVAPCEIDQGWLRGSTIEERVRRIREGEGVRYFRTVKVGTGLRRIELEEETDKLLFDALWPLTRGRRVRKKRYRIPENGLVWEIDKFSGRKLILAEVELPSESAPVDVPAWLAPHVVREVTGVQEFYNIHLAR